MKIVPPDTALQRTAISIRCSVAGGRARSSAALLRPASIAIALLLLLAACSPHGPIAELGLGWMREAEDLERLEQVFTLSGFQPELVHYLTEESASASGKPWRLVSNGTISSYFEFSAEDDHSLRAIITLSARTGRLRVRIHSFRSECKTKLFLAPDQEQLDFVERNIRERLAPKARFQYVTSERC